MATHYYVPEWNWKTRFLSSYFYLVSFFLSLSFDWGYIDCETAFSSFRMFVFFRDLFWFFKFIECRKDDVCTCFDVHVLLLTSMKKRVVVWAGRPAPICPSRLENGCSVWCLYLDEHHPTAKGRDNLNRSADASARPIIPYLHTHTTSTSTSTSLSSRTRGRAPFQ
jgi:hypothetical protein